MAERDYLAAVRDHVVVFDGSMGALLEDKNLSLEDDYKLPGRAHEVLVLNRPDVIEELHNTMLDAGATVLETDSFQASRLKLDEWGLADHTLEINQRAAEIARKAAGPDRFVAGSIGPTGFLPSSDDPTLGNILFPELVTVFEEQARGLIQGGSDLLIIETAQDILEVKAAIFGAREAFKATGRRVPLQISVSLLPNGGKMLLGTDIASVLTTLEALKVDVVGLNCSTGPEDMRDAIRYLGTNARVPVHCIPNAGIPQQGVNGETVFPEKPQPLADALGEFVDQFGVAVVGGCCGTTPEHISAIAERVAKKPAGATANAGTVKRDIQVSSMIAAADLVQQPRPTIVGERVNSQGSRKAKELLLADDYDSLVTIAEGQVEGGAHVLDVCVALTERSDEAEQMRQVVKKISLTQPAPIQIDSTEPDVIKIALEQIPGRAIVNSVNLEAGRDKMDLVVPLAIEHGAAVIALTIDEIGMGKTVERKLEIAERIAGITDEHGLEREALIFDLLTFTLTTGDEEWRDSAVQTIEAIRAIGDRLPGVKTSLGVSNVSFGVGLAARSVLNSVFLFHCVEAGLDLAMVNPAHIIPMGEIDPTERELAEDLVWNRREDALERFINHFESKGPGAETESKADPTAEMEPEEALHFRILKRKKDGVEADIDRAVEKLGAVPVLNDVLLPAMKEVGDKFGAGELILPFVLQSAEVMKKAVKQLENYLERTADYTKGTVVLATVFGDVHDIGKSLVNTILSNNGYTVIDLGKQVPVGTILEAAKEHDATAIGLSALLVSTSKQMPLAVQELHREGLKFPVLVGGAAINRNFSYRALHPNGLDDDTAYEGGVFYCKDAFEGLGVMDRMVDQGELPQMLEEIKAGAIKLRNAAKQEEDLPPLDDTSVRSPARTDVPIPEPPFWGVREIPVDMDELYHHLDTHVLFKLHWGGRGIKGEAWRKLIEGDPTDEDAGEGFRHKLERMWAEQDYLNPRALIGFFPCYADGNDVVVLDPEDRKTEINRFVSPRQQKGARMCTADFFRPGVKQADGTVVAPDELDVIAVQALTVGERVTELMAELEQAGEYAEQLFVHGLGVQTAEGLSEWLHWKVRNWFGIPVTQGRRLSWGYPAIPDQSEHEKVRDLLDIGQIGMDLTDGYSPTPEQSTLAMVLHHPQAVYYGMRNGRFMENGTPDDVIKDTERDPTRIEAGFLEAEVEEVVETA